MTDKPQSDKNNDSSSEAISMDIRITLTAVILLTMACIGDFPYGFYKLLRVAICGYFAYNAGLSYIKSKINFSFIVSVLFAILFNPFAKIGFNKDEWRTIDAITILAIAILSVTEHVTSRKKTPKKD